MCSRVDCPPVASNPPADLFLQPLTGKGFPISGWLVQYQLLLIALDPFTNESAWAFPTAATGRNCSTAMLANIGAAAWATPAAFGPNRNPGMGNRSRWF